MTLAALRDFRFQYEGADQPILKGVNLEVESGDWVLISGASGCGKTTLAMALSGFLFHPLNGTYSGEVMVNGESAVEMPLYKAAEHVYLVQQNPENQFCTLTVEDEIAFGLENRLVPPEEILETIGVSLEAVKGSSLRDRNLMSLSGGEQQKIAIATALALQPQLLILDEPTSNLDPESSEHLYSILADLQGKKDFAVILIEHRIHQASGLATKHIHLEDGCLREIQKLNKKRRNHNKNFPDSKSQISERNSILSLKNLRIFREEKEVLSIENMDISKGEMISLMGANGSGKTSFLLAIMGFIPSQFDTMEIFGHRSVKNRVPNVGKEIGFVFQNPDHQLFCDSVDEEMQTAVRNFNLKDSISDGWINYLVETFGLADFRDQHPFLLSYGQKSRLNLASVLAYQPKLLLLDEIFIGQDEENVFLMLKEIKEYIRNSSAAAIVVNHQYWNMKSFANRFIFLENGRAMFDVAAEDSEQVFSENRKEMYLQ